MEYLKEQFGKRIQKIRKSKKITQEKLAEIIGLDIPNISNIERGKRFVSSSTLEKITEALNVSPKELFDFEDYKTREEIIKEITEAVQTSSDKELNYYYGMIKLFREST